MEEEGQHNDLQTSYIKVKNGVVPKGYRGIVKSGIQHQFGTQYLSTQTGRQHWVIIGNLITRDQIIASAATSGQTTADSWPANPYTMNPYCTNTGSGTLGSILEPAIDKCYIHNIRGEIDLTNLENISQEITLYLVKYRLTTSTDPINIWGNYLTSTAQFNQVNAVQQTNIAGAIYGRPFTTTYGQVPTTCPGWRRSFQIIKRVHHVLMPGSTHKVKYDIAYNRFMDKQYFTDASSGESFVKGYTMCWMMCIKGAPVWDAPAVGLKAMTPGPVDVGYCHTYKVSFSYPMAKRLYAFRTDAGFENTSTITDDKIINDVDAQANIVQQ